MNRAVDSATRVQRSRWMCRSAPVRVEVARFRGSEGVEELHLTAKPRAAGTVERHLTWLRRGTHEVLDAIGFDRDSTVLCRFFCSDLANQTPTLAADPFSAPGAHGKAAAVSWIGQAPLGLAKVALWAYHLADPSGCIDKRLAANTLTVHRGALAHHWTCGMTSTAPAPACDQTMASFAAYHALLSARKLKLADHLVRTWLFLRDIDADYSAMNAARRRFFAEHGLTPETHYVASTGIESAGAPSTVRVLLDAYAIGGLHPGQVRYLRAPEHLSATVVYGVTFERATSLAYRDRTHVLISGTASIDARGNTLHSGDILRQLERTMENIEALLAEGQAGSDDLVQLTAYVRDPRDGPAVRRGIRARFGNVPLIVVRGAVCRPEWLVEIEGQAIVSAARPDLPPF